jgi:peptidoglycan/xylan/chitin deacetylase (PgdA/CDA1 family)
MRLSLAVATAFLATLGATEANAQKAPLAPQMEATGSIGRAAAPAAQRGCPGNPNALGTARIVEIDTTGGPGFGFEHFKMHDFLQPGEVVLTFDDGPWLNNTSAVLAALAQHCTKATFFSIGKHATYYPDILRQVAAQGHSVGSHTWSHANLAKLPVQEAKDEIEKGFSAVRWALQASPAPFFRFPTLSHPQELIAYLGERNIATFSTDLDSFDFRLRKADKMIEAVMTKLKKHGKGIVLMHDFQHVTAGAAPALLNEIAAGGYKVVHMRGQAPVKTLADYDAALVAELAKSQKSLSTTSTKPTASVVKTVTE